MYRFAFRLTGQRDDAEDLVQDVLAKLFPKAEELFAVEQHGAWLNRVLYRHFIDLTRKQGRRADRPASSLMSEEAGQNFLDSLVDRGAEPDRQLSDRQLRLAMDEALNSLPPDQRSLLLLHDVDGWNQEDIAKVLDVAVGTVKSRLHRCRAGLRKNLGEQLEPFVTGMRVED
ncbi:MAG: RNA polymerase sigma factor [Oleiphilaceae bacterium]|nr:RNA polymerase sigma factor [Oleiphilaceae bacterium]